MNRVAWITDSTTASFKTEGDNFVIPIEVIIDGVSYKDCEEGVRERVYNALNEGKTVTTSQPNIGEMVELFSKCKEEYEEGFAVAISGKVSGTYQNMKLAAEMAGFPLTVLVEEKRRPFHVFPKSLKGLYASGRVKGVQFLLGSLLSVNLILEVKGGELLLEKKVRKIQKCREYIKNELEKELPKVLHMFHANDKAGAEEWIADIRQAFPEMDFKLYPLPISFAVHAGEGTIAISY
ncbi:DegV family protein [Bacillus cereus]|uniref:DEGV protein n=1 Tax=Bacillus cereus VD184 TaxID=1053242 RepID=A0A9W5VSQ9_BACCE|nr:DegV family protein [Bacillus cereus]EOQ14262.1 DEGV protein [Bacillus cereus VD184]